MTPTGDTCSIDFFRSSRPGYSHPVSSELENSGIRVAVGNCSVTESRRWRPPYHIGKTVHVHAKHYKHNEGRHTVPDVCGNGSVPLSYSRNVVTRIGAHTHTGAITANLIGRTHGAQYRGYGCIPLRFGGGGGGGGGGGASLEEWDTTTVAVTRYQTWISIPHMVACAELPYKKTYFMPVHEICIPVCCLRLSRQQSLMGNRPKADHVA